MNLNKSQLKELILEKKYAGLPDDEQYISGYIYALFLNPIEPMNIRLDGTRKVSPLHVAAFLNFNEREVILKEIKNGKILKKEIYFSSAHKPDVKFFISKEDCLQEYQEDMNKAFESLNALILKVNDFKNEISKGLAL